MLDSLWLDSLGTNVIFTCPSVWKPRHLKLSTVQFFEVFEGESHDGGQQERKCDAYGVVEVS